MTTQTGFFEGEPGVRSMTRLTLFICTCLEALMIAATAFVAVWGVMHPTDAVAPVLLGALTLANTPLVTGILLTLREKRKNDEGTSDPAPPSQPQVTG